MRTDIYQRLAEQENLRLVLFVGSQERAAYYRKEFSRPNVFYEVVGQRKNSWFEKIFSELKFWLLRTDTVDLRKRMALEETRSYLSYYLAIVLNRIFARRSVRKVVRVLDYFLVKSETFKNQFELYKPDLVFLAHLFDDLEIDMLREAKRRNVVTVGFINSWDKLTAARGIIRVLPEKLIVFNELVYAEAEEHADMSAKDIFISGIPNYDWHVNHKPKSRNEFFAAKKIDPRKKLIVYAPMGKTYSNSDWDIIDLLRSAIASGEIKDAQLLVRFQPNDFADEAEINKRPGLVYDIPGIRFSAGRGVDWDMSFGDIKNLTDTLANADLFICYASSMSIDAAVFDKPVINIDFEVKEKELMSKSPTYFYKMTHYQNAVRSGGISFPKSREEFIETINRYLADPFLDYEGRKRLVSEQCWKIDGRAGSRIADFIYDYSRAH